MAKQKRALAAALAVVILGGAAAARADDKDDARKLLEQGDAYLDKGDQRRDKGRVERAKHYYGLALTSYQKAYELVPNSGIFYAIAGAEARLERYMEAIEHYRRVIAEVDKPELAAEARARIDELKVHVAELVVDVTPAGAEVSLNAELRGVAPLPEGLLLAPGEYTLTVTAEGCTPHEVKLTLDKGRTEQEIALEPIPVIVKKPKQTDTDVTEELRKAPVNEVVAPSKTWLYVSGGVAGGLLAGGAVTAVALAGQTDGGSHSGLTTATIVLASGGVVAGGVFAYHYYRVYRPRRRAYERAMTVGAAPKLWLVPYVDSGGAGVAVGGRF